MSYIDDIFGPSGVFSREFPGYEIRDGQIYGANAVDYAISHDENALIEAPTGLGKSAMYLIPAIKRMRTSAVPDCRDCNGTGLWVGDDGSERQCYVCDGTGKGKNRIVISTANISLQDQLINKDLPLLGRILPWKFTYAILKGRHNYLCKRSCEEVSDQDPTDPRILKILKWSGDTEYGDKNELDIPNMDSVWGQFSVSSDECIGKTKCHFGQECWFENARRRAGESDIIVTNHMMLAIHLKIFKESNEHIILPRFSTVIIDEAHELPHYARKAWGFKSALRSVKRAIGPWRKLEEDLYNKTVRKNEIIFSDLTTIFEKLSGNTRIPRDIASRALHDIANSLAEMKSEMERGRMAGIYDGDVDKYDNGVKRVDSLIGSLSANSEMNDAAVVWLERDGRDEPVSLNVTTLDIGAQLKEALFERIPSAICTSATLATGSGEKAMKYMEGELGITRHRSYILDSPFDLKKQLRVHIPTMPDPNSDKFTSAVAESVEGVIKAARGRTLALFTSFKVMDAVYKIVSGRVPYRILKQGDAPVPKLVAEFKADVSSVMFGVASLWTGIDVPGEALSCLLIDKMPFTPPSDPIISAYEEKLGRDCFHRVSLPSAIMRFRQGAGRLIRNTTDRGVIVVLDSRVRTKPYGRAFLSAYADVPRISVVSEITSFLDLTTAMSGDRISP